MATMQFSITCPDCKGYGETIPIGSECDACGGNGTTAENSSIEIGIPKGCSRKDIVTCYGIGNVGANGGPAGDLLVRIMIREHPFFLKMDVRGDRLYCIDYNKLHCISVPWSQAPPDDVSFEAIAGD